MLFAFNSLEMSVQVLGMVPIELPSFQKKTREYLSFGKMEELYLQTEWLTLGHALQAIYRRSKAHLILLVTNAGLPLCGSPTLHVPKHERTALSLLLIMSF